MADAKIEDQGAFVKNGEAYYFASTQQHSAVKTPCTMSPFDILSETLENYSFIRDVSDFPAPVGDLITLDSSIVYLITGDIDMGVKSLVVPVGGVSISSLNGGRDVCILSSTEDNYTLFVSPAGSYSGDVLLTGITMNISGAFSKVYDLDNDENGNAMDVVGVNYLNCSSLGEMTSYRQVLLDDVGIINCSDGLTFNGTWAGGLAVITTIAINFPTATLFKEGTSLVFNGSVRSDANFLFVDSGAVFMDFTESNIASDSGVTLNGFRTSAIAPLPNLPSSSVKVKYSGCKGIRNTYVGGGATVSVGATTAIIASDTLVKMAGTTVYSDMQWFSSLTDNAFIFDSDEDIEINIEASLSFTGGNNNVMGLQIRKWDESALSYVDVGAEFNASLNGGGVGDRPANITCLARASVSKDDRIEVWVKNTSDTSDITTVAGGFIGIEERPS